MSRLTLTTSRMIPELLGRAFLAGLTPQEIYAVKRNVNRADELSTFYRSSVLRRKYYDKFDSYVRSVFTPSELDDLRRARINSLTVVIYHVKNEVGEKNYEQQIRRAVKVGAAKVGTWWKRDVQNKPVIVKPIEVNNDVWKHFTTVNYSPVQIVTA